VTAPRPIGGTIATMHAHSHGGPSAADLRTAAGVRAAQISSLALLVTGAVELAIFAIGNSAGLLADAIHNLGDVTTTLALWAAFALSRRRASERYPHGFHRVEDLAGLFVLLVMVASAVAAGYESLQHLITGTHPTHLALGAAAAIVGVVGNEATAMYKERVGRRIGSVSLVADAAHSRTDGLVSLAALAGIVGVALGFERADGIAGVLITVVIATVILATSRSVLGRALDAVEPELTQQVQRVAGGVTGVLDVHDVRLRWAGRALFGSLNISLPGEMSLDEAHAVAEEVRHALLHEIESLREIEVHMDPAEHDPAHALTAHHFEDADDQHDHAADDHDHDEDDRDHADGHDHADGYAEPGHDGHDHATEPVAHRLDDGV
jgi:cation diffusion facilitator family transporter